MKTQFFEYYKPSVEELNLLIKDGLMVFDTNVLLDIFRLSPKNGEELLKLFERKKDQIWIPYQVGKEFHSDIYGVLKSQVAICDSVIANLKEIRKKFVDGIISLPQNESEKIGKRCDNIIKEIISIKKEKERLVSSDNKLLNRIGELLDGKVGDGFSEEELKKIYNEGEERYKNRIPPGYKDKKKDKNDKKVRKGNNGNEDDEDDNENEIWDGDDNSKYGDLIIWKEIIKKANESGKSVIFISNDQKEDWCMKCCGKVIGPRPELRREFLEQTRDKNLLFYSYTRDNFLELLKEHDKVNVSSDLEKELIQVDKSLSDEINLRDDISEYIIYDGNPITFNGKPIIVRTPINLVEGHTEIENRTILDDILRNVTSPNEAEADGNTGTSKPDTDGNPDEDDASSSPQASIE